MLSRAMHFNEYLGVQALFFFNWKKKKKNTTGANITRPGNTQIGRKAQAHSHYSGMRWDPGQPDDGAIVHRYILADMS